MLRWNFARQMMSEEEDGDDGLRAKSLEIVESFLSGTLSADEALNAWPPFSGKKNRQLFGLYEAIDHFRTDSDIREKEPEYEQYQMNVIREIYERLTFI